MMSDTGSVGLDVREEELDTGDTILDRVNACARQLGRLQVFMEQLESKLSPILLPEETAVQIDPTNTAKKAARQTSPLGEELQVVSRDLVRLEARLNLLLARVQL